MAAKKAIVQQLLKGGGMDRVACSFECGKVTVMKCVGKMCEERIDVVRMESMTEYFAPFDVRFHEVTVSCFTARRHAPMRLLQPGWLFLSRIDC